MYHMIKNKFKPQQEINNNNFTKRIRRILSRKISGFRILILILNIIFKEIKNPSRINLANMPKCLIIKKIHLKFIMNNNHNQ